MDSQPTDPPATVYRYSDLNLITLGVLVERITGTTLDRAVATGITRPPPAIGACRLTSPHAHG